MFTDRDINDGEPPPGAECVLRGPLCFLLRRCLRGPSEQDLFSSLSSLLSPKVVLPHIDLTLVIIIKLIFSGSNLDETK